MRIANSAIVIAAFVLGTGLHAQDKPDGPVSAAQKSEVVRTLGTKLREAYVFPDKAEATADALQDKSDAGAYASYTTSQAFADALRTDLRAAGDDRHLQVRYDPSFREMQHDHGAPSPEDVRTMREEMAANGYGVQRTAHLPGNIGYLDLRFFGPTEFVAPAYEAAMQLLAGSRAIIIDLRSNGGGDPSSVAQLASHFFAAGDERHLNSIYSRTDGTTRDFWTVRSAGTRFTGPVYVLTSDYTFSGGEELAYDLQTQERATLIGETTGGGANPGAPLSLGHGFYAFIPSGRAINPVTKTNWEHVGVVPHHKVEAETALAAAYRMALEEAASSEADSGIKAGLEKLSQDLPAELPRWKHPRE